METQIVPRVKNSPISRLLIVLGQWAVSGGRLAVTAFCFLLSAHCPNEFDHAA
jgi:hypothetical protein